MDTDAPKPEPTHAPKRRRQRKDDGGRTKGPKIMAKMTLNLTLPHREYVALKAHVAANTGNDDGTCSGVVARLITEHLKTWRVSHHDGAGQGDGEKPG